MGTGRLLVAVAAIAGWAGAGLAACVGDTPSTPSSTTDDGGGGGDSSNDAAVDTGGATTDAADSGTDAGVDAAITCGAPPSVHNPIPGQGVFCGGVGSSVHCAFGQHCCRDFAANTEVCADGCDAGLVDMACQNTTECGDAGVCCGRGTTRTDLCSYLVVKDFVQTSCQATCNALDFQLCSDSPADCAGSGKTCTPAKALEPDSKSTDTLQISACR